MLQQNTFKGDCSGVCGVDVRANAVVLVKVSGEVSVVWL